MWKDLEESEQVDNNMLEILRATGLGSASPEPRRLEKGSASRNWRQHFSEIAHGSAKLCRAQGTVNSCLGLRLARQ